MAQVQREGEPQVIEQSAVVSRLFENDLKLISNSRENSLYYLVKTTNRPYMVTDILTKLLKEN